MKSDSKYFRNNLQTDILAPGTLWKLEANYFMPVDIKNKIMVAYIGHEDWYTEVKKPVELQFKKS